MKFEEGDLPSLGKIQKLKGANQITEEGKGENGIPAVCPEIALEMAALRNLPDGLPSLV